VLPLPLLWSHGTRPVPKEDASTATVLADDGGLDGPPVRRSPEGQTWKRRRRIMDREESWRMGVPADDVVGGGLVEP
jgi:hypothetical protein